MATKTIRDRVERVLAELDEERGRERGRMFEEWHNKKHYHKCPDDKCAFIWSHKTSDFKSSRDFEDGHKCPKCRKEQSIRCTRTGAPLP